MRVLGAGATSDVPIFAARVLWQFKWGRCAHSLGRSLAFGAGARCFCGCDEIVWPEIICN